MQTPAPLRSREHPVELEREACRRVSKTQKAADHTPDLKTPPAHQDESLAIPLQKEALRALGRQNTQAARKPPASHRVRRPATRLAFADWKRDHQPLIPAHTYLEICGHEQYLALLNFSKHGGPDLRELRGCERPPYHISNNPMTLSQAVSTSWPRSRRTTKTKPTTESGATSKSLSLYNRTFQQTIIDCGVFPPNYKDPDGNFAPKPANLDYIKQRLAQRRPSLSPSEFTKEHHEAFFQKNASAAKENDVNKKVFPIQGEIKDDKTASGQIPFTNFTPLTTNKTLVSGNPDIYYGARPEQLDSRIRDELGPYVAPSTQRDLPIIPNHITTLKGPDGSIAVALRQATYDIYFGVQAIDAIKSYGQTEPRHDGNAYAFSSIYHNGQLELYTSYSTAPTNPGGRPSYHMNFLRSFSMRDTPQTWREGATWYRNSVDLAKEFRDAAIRAANQVVDRVQVPVSSYVSSMSESLGSTGSRLGPDPPTVDSQVVESGLSVPGDDFQNAEGPPGEEDEPMPPSPAGRFGRQRNSPRKRRNRKESEDLKSTPSSSQENGSQASSLAAKKGKGGARSRKKRAR